MQEDVMDDVMLDDDVEDQVSEKQPVMQSKTRLTTLCSDNESA